MQFKEDISSVFQPNYYSRHIDYYFIDLHISLITEKSHGKISPHVKVIVRKAETSVKVLVIVRNAKMKLPNAKMKVPSL